MTRLKIVGKSHSKVGPPSSTYQLYRSRPIGLEVMHLEITQRKREAMMPTSAGASSASRSTSHSAMPRLVQYLRGLGGGITSTGGLQDRRKTHRCNRAAHGSARYRSNASYPAGQARMAGGCARGSRRTGTAHELKWTDNRIIWPFQVGQEQPFALRCVRKVGPQLRQLKETSGYCYPPSRAVRSYNAPSKGQSSGDLLEKAAGSSKSEVLGRPPIPQSVRRLGG
jgi:hypothetical protein